MTWKGIDGRGLTIPLLKEHINGLNFTTWRPSGMALHNTKAPTLAQWNAQNAAQRIKNLENYFKNVRGWSSGPHAFVDDNLVWLFTPFTTQGTHSPSWNGTRIGIEMVGDFSVEDDDTGRGLKVKKNTVALFALLHQKLGLDPETIKLHNEDPRTDHDCPGKDIDKAEFISLVQQYMGEAGDHDVKALPIFDDQPTLPPPRWGIVKVPANDVLNMRNASSASAPIVATLHPGEKVKILTEAMNGDTRWFRVEAGPTGWAAARFIQTI